MTDRLSLWGPSSPKLPVCPTCDRTHLSSSIPGNSHWTTSLPSVFSFLLLELHATGLQVLHPMRGVESISEYLETISVNVL